MCGDFWWIYSLYVVQTVVLFKEKSERAYTFCCVRLMPLLTISSATAANNTVTTAGTYNTVYNSFINEDSLV